jgi:hypothetical protein
VIVILGLAVTIWAATRIQSKNGALVLIVLSIMMLLVGGGLIPPVLGVLAEIIVARVRQKGLKKNLPSEGIKLAKLNPFTCMNQTPLSPARPKSLKLTTTEPADMISSNPTDPTIVMGSHLL